jgi:hypothetical protein
MNVRFRHIINKAKRLVDVAPHWGEPRTSGVLWFSLCNDYLCYVFLSDYIRYVMDMYILL